MPHSSSDYLTSHFDLHNVYQAVCWNADSSSGEAACHLTWSMLNGDLHRCTAVLVTWHVTST